MNFPLQDIEFHIDDQYIEQAEILLQQQALLGMDEIERHLWVFKIMGNLIYEVEIQISPSKVKAMSCECPQFRQHKICAHTTLALLSIRKHINQLNEQKKQQKQQKRLAPSFSKLTTNRILENVSLEQLKDFVRHYSKRNRNFSLALKARFASAVPSADSEAKYQHLFEMTLKAVSREGSKISVSGSKQLTNLLAQFIRHAEEAELRNDYAEVTAIIKVVFSKSGGLISRMGKEQQLLLQLLHDYLVLLRRMLKQEIAPALKEEIWSFMLSKIDHGAYKKHGLTASFIQTLIPLARELQSTEELIEFIDRQLEETGKHKNDEKVQLILSKFSILEDAGQHTEANELLNEHLAEPEILLKVIEQTIQSDKLDIARQLSEQSLEDSELAAYHRPIRDFLLEVAVKQNDSPLVIQLARQQFLHNYELLYYEMLKKQSRWRKYIMPDLLTELKGLPYKIPVRDAIGHILYDNQDIEALFAYIREIKSFDLLMRYDGELLRSKRESTIELYRNLLEDYLSNHLGRQSSQKVRHIIEHLFTAREEQLAQELIELFRQEYPERHSLIEELEIFE